MPLCVAGEMNAQLLKLARANKQTELATALERRIALYERGAPVREG